jgi:hypothetical protein
MGNRDSFLHIAMRPEGSRYSGRRRSANRRRRLLAERLEPRHLLTTIDLAVLTADQGSLIEGVNSGDASGFSVSIAGDVNGDGFDDLLIGAFSANAAGNAKSNAGESYLVFGGPTLPATIDLAALGTAGVTIYGVDVDDESGRTVSAAGDVNGDGFDDLFIAAPLADAAGNAKTDAAESYLILGRASFPAAIDLATGGADVTIFGADSGDGYIGAPYDYPVSLANAGDVNGDGFDEILIGAALADGAGNAKNWAGDTYLIYGGPTLPGTIDLASLGSLGVIIYGAEIGD